MAQQDKFVNYMEQGLRKAVDDYEKSFVLTSMFLVWYINRDFQLTKLKLVSRWRISEQNLSFTSFSALLLSMK